MHDNSALKESHIRITCKCKHSTFLIQPELKTYPAVSLKIRCVSFATKKKQHKRKSFAKHSVL